MTVLRAAMPTDAGAVGDILSQFVDTTHWMPRIHTRAQDLAHAAAMIDRGWVTLAEDAGEVVAFLARDGAEVNALYVAATARGQGFGTALLGHAQDCMGMLELWTFQANIGAQRFYRRHGFIETRRTDGAQNDEGLPDIRFEWQREAA